MAVGVAKPNAHGQEITNTAIAHVKAKWKVCPPRVTHKTNVTKAITITTGTKIPLI